MEPIIIDNQRLVDALRRAAKEENRSIDDVLDEMLQAREAAKPAPRPSAEEQQAMVHKVRLQAYEEARRYWRETGNEERLALTDEQLDEQFWLFDADGVPRLKSEMDQVEILDGSLYRLGEAMKKVGFRSGRSDIASRSKDILRAEFADHIQRRTHKRNQHGE